MREIKSTTNLSKFMGKDNSFEDIIIEETEVESSMSEEQQSF